MYPLVFLSALFLPLDGIGAKTNKTTGNAKLLSVAFITAFAAVISWVVSLALGNRVSSDMLLYAVLFAVLYVLGTVLAYAAYSLGSLSGTALFGNSSLVVVILFSCFYFNEKFSYLSAVGVIGTLISLVLLNLPGKSITGKREKFNLSWLLVCIGILLCNSLLSISSKLRQTDAGGENAFAFMALCYSFTFAVSIAAYLISQLKKRTLVKDAKEVKESFFPLLTQAGGNAGSNLLVTFLSTRVSAAVLYPVNQGLGLILTVLCGFLFFKDRANIKNILGIIIGVLAIILLNL